MRLPRAARHNAVRSCQRMVNRLRSLCRDPSMNTRHTFNLCRVPCVKCTWHICALCRDPSPAHHGKAALCRAPPPTAHGKTPLPSTFASPLFRAPPPTPHGKLTIWSSASCQVSQVGAMCGLCRAQLHGTGLCRVPSHGKVTIWHRFLLFLQKSLHFTEKSTIIHRW